jgi:pyruvate dehydrogenase E1 component beta subunit
MSNGQFRLPIVFRGRAAPRTRSPAQHSQALEVALRATSRAEGGPPATPSDAKGLLKRRIRDDNPVVFIESEVMYALKGEVPGRAPDPARARRR